MPPILAALVVLAAASAPVAPPPPPPIVAAPLVPGRATIQVVPKPPPPSLATTLGAFGFSVPLRPLQSFIPLQGLPPAGDTSPQCRTDCTKSRAVCGTDDECGEQWRQCVASCASAAR